jgi:hypothetical protein
MDTRTLIAVSVLAFIISTNPITGAVADTNPVAADTTVHDPVDSSAFPIDIRFAGYFKVWWVLLEDDQNGLQHPITGEQAVDGSSGFLMHRARIGVEASVGRVTGRVTARLENSPPGMLDAYFFVPLFDRRLQLWLGQMRVPSTYEVMTPGSQWDFLTRSRFSTRVVDFSLSRGPIPSYSRFYGAKAYSRDLGIGLKGTIGVQAFGARYFVMIGNGLGANRFIGGQEGSGEVSANRLGDYLYAARLTIGTRQSRLARKRSELVQFFLGGHVSWNQHSNIVLDDERTVLNIKRWSWSVDLETWFSDFLRLTGMYGQVVVDDDFDDDGKRDYQFDGWELKAMASLKPDVFEIGLRYDTLADEFYENGVEDKIHSYTFCINYTILPNLKTQLNYKYNDFRSDVDPDIDFGVSTLSAQFQF